MNDLLKVLDISEDEQFEYLENTGIIDLNKTCFYKDYGNTYTIDKKGTLADLSFRLRDKVVKNIDISLEVWAKALRKVFLTEFKGGSEITMLSWYVNCAKPIHWVIAALIAKQSKDANNGKDS